MENFSLLLNLACGAELPDEANGRARRLQLVAAALLAALAFAALWGLAAGGRSVQLSLANVYKVPMVVLLSAVCAVPAGMLTWKLCGAAGRGTDMLVSFATSVFGATLILAALAPVVALYDHSSAWAGPLLTVASALLALAVGTLVFVRSVLRRGKRAILLVPAAVFVLIQLATLLQLIALASPIVPERTIFSHGIDPTVSEVER